MKVFDSFILVELGDIDDMSNGVYKSEVTAMTRKCKILAVGRGYISNGTIIPLEHVVGDSVHIREGAWIEVEEGGEKHYVSRASDIVLGL